MKTATISIGGRERIMRFDMNTLAYLDDQGYDSSKGFRVSDFRTPKKIRILLGAFLATDSYKELKRFHAPEEIGEWMGFDNLPQVLADMEKLTSDNAPDQEEKAEDPPKAAAP